MVKENSNNSKNLRQAIAEFVNSMSLVLDPNKDKLKLYSRSVFNKPDLKKYLAKEIGKDFSTLLNVVRESVDKIDNNVPMEYDVLAKNLSELARIAGLEEDCVFHARDYVGNHRLTYGFGEVCADLDTFLVQMRSIAHDLDSYDLEIEDLKKSRRSWRTEALRARGEINSYRLQLGLPPEEIPGDNRDSD